MNEEIREEVRQGFADGTYHAIGYSLPCPYCNKLTTVFEEGSQWFCWTCWKTFETPEVVYYGGEYDELLRLVEFLEGRR